MPHLDGSAGFYRRCFGDDRVSNFSGLHVVDGQLNTGNPTETTGDVCSDTSQTLRDQRRYTAVEHAERLNPQQCYEAENPVIVKRMKEDET